MTEQFPKTRFPASAALDGAHADGLDARGTPPSLRFAAAVRCAGAHPKATALPTSTLNRRPTDRST